MLAPSVECSHRWRKAPNLQGWMESLWRERFDVQTGDFCCEIQLDAEDIERLQVDIMAGDLPDTDGFFFGSNSDDHYREQDMEFCKWALTEIEAGREVYYDSSW